MTERQIEMLWKCTSCGARNLGRYGVCQTCKNPKDGSEEWFMPDDTSAAATVTDPKLLAMATAGANWRCAYCGSDQRSSDGSCKSCGAAKAEGTSLDDLEPKAPAAAPAKPKKSRKRLVLAILGGLFASAGSCVGCVLWLAAPQDLQAQVASVRWEHQVKVDRWQAVPHEGFVEAQPKTAIAIQKVGSREHHRAQVLDHYETEHYTEKVQDGTRTERYTERVKCGETCTDRPKSCRESCKSNKNGFATCKTVCSGGGRSCSSKYCSESRTRQVPKYKDVDRTRQVPRYRSEPRFADWFSWRNWEWKRHRVLKAAGENTEVRWPSDEEIAAGATLADGEKERTAREASYAVELVVHAADRDRTFKHAPKTPEEFARFAVGSAHMVRVTPTDELLAVDPPIEK